MCHFDNSEARLRAMRAADVDGLVDLWVASWRETLPEIDFDARRGWIATFLLDPAHLTLTAWHDETPLGFVSLEDAYLHQLVVTPREKGSGIAKRLLDAAKAAAPAGLTLDVNQANSRAVAFYMREGFVTTARGANPTSGLATLTMRWRP